MRNNPTLRESRHAPRTALVVLICAIALAALIGCSSGAGDPPAQPGTGLADFQGYWIEDPEVLSFNLTIEAGEIPGTTVFIAPTDRSAGTVSLSGGTATLKASAEAYYDDAEQTITINADSPWEAVFEKYSGGTEPLEGFWVAEISGNEFGLSIELDSGSSTSGSFEYFVQGLTDPLYSGTFTCEYDGDDASIEIAYLYGTATLSASKDVLSLSPVYDPEEPLELFKTTPAIPTLEDYESTWVFTLPGVAQYTVSINASGEISYTKYNGVGGIAYRNSGTLTVDAQGAGHAASSMLISYEHYYDDEEEDLIADIPGVSGNTFSRTSGEKGSVVGSWRHETDDEAVVWLSFNADGTMSYIDPVGVPMSGTYDGDSFSASGELGELGIDTTMRPRIIYFTPSGGSELILMEQPI